MFEKCRVLKSSSSVDYLSSANNTGGVSGRYFTQHVISKNEKTSTVAPLAFYDPI